MSAEEVIKTLQLIPHPEGGFYREIFRSDVRVQHPNVPPGEERERAASTLIYFLLEAKDFSAFHRVRSEETWHLYGGGPLELHLIHQHGEYEQRILRRDLGAGFSPQTTVDANVWQAACPAPNVEWVLCGCTVAPGFEFADFSMASRKELTLSYPECQEIINRFTRE
ncbi:cupin domain-containing protein [bacterium]|nr:cupin domain-containing protein [bacterium]